jgi:hypothetical protein
MAFGISYEEFRGFYLAPARRCGRGWVKVLGIGGTRFPNLCSPYALDMVLKKVKVFSKVIY